MNAAVRDNLIVLRAGGVAMTSQAANDLVYASSSTQFARIAGAASSVLVTSAGSVPSLSTSLPSGLTIPAPVFSGTITGTYTVGGTPTLPLISSTNYPATTSAQFAGVISNETGSGLVVFDTSPTLTTPALGTPSAAVLTNATGLPIATGLSGLGAADRIPYATSATALATSANLTYNGSVVTITAASDGATALTVANRGTFTMTSNVNNLQTLAIDNDATGTAAAVVALLSAGTTTLRLQAFSQGFTTSGDALAAGVLLRGEGAGGLSLSATDASGDVRIYSRNALAATFGASQALTLTGLLTASAVGTHTFGGAGANVLKITGNNSTTGATEFYIGNDASATNGALTSWGSAKVTSGPDIADSLKIYAERAGGIVLAAQSATGPIRFFSAGTTEVGRWDLTSSLQVGGSAARATTAGTKRLDIFDGTAPVGTLANGISLYATTGELRVMDAAGNATLLSPHDDDTNEWIYFSKNTVTGQVLRIDMERLMRRLDKEYGGGFIEEYTEDPAVTPRSGRKKK